MKKTIYGAGILFGLSSVAFGAFAAHGLEGLLDAKALNTFDTGVRYQMYHALLLIIMGNSGQVPEKNKAKIYYALLAGIMLFSFSIYLLATNTLTGFDFRAIGFLTPIGGVLLIVAWGLLGYEYLRR